MHVCGKAGICVYVCMMLEQGCVCVCVCVMVEQEVCACVCVCMMLEQGYVCVVRQGCVCAPAYFCARVYMRVCAHACTQSLQSHLTLCDPMDKWLLCPWDCSGKNTGVGCHFLLQGIFQA